MIRSTQQNLPDFPVNPTISIDMTTATLDTEQARTYMHKLLATMKDAGGSDLFISADFPPSMKSNGQMSPLSKQKLPADVTRQLAHAMMTDAQRAEFEREMECNFAVWIPGVARFRVNVFRQQQCVGMVLRTIPTTIPTFESLMLPDVLKDVTVAKRGLVMVVGAAGCGKSTTLAAMLDHRNQMTSDHIITVEDPVEFVHTSKKCLITHREVGIDTHSWHNALKNTLRQAPDVILIGEVRDAETMEHAIAFSETGHLCLCTLHANSATHSLDRIVNFFPEERKKQVLMDLSANLRAIVSQRLVRTPDGKGRRAAIEILINTPLVSEKIFNGEFGELKEVMGKSREYGMRTFDWALFELYNDGLIGYEEALRNADSANELRLNIKLKSPRGEPKTSSFGVELTMQVEEDEASEPDPKDADKQQAKKADSERQRLEAEYQRSRAATEARRKKEDEELQRLSGKGPAPE